MILLGAASHTAPELSGSFSTNCLFLGANMRKAVLNSRGDCIPSFLHETPRLLAGRNAPDWALVQLTLPDRHGFCSLGLSGEVVIGAIRSAKRVIAEFNPQLPRTLGDTLVHADQLHAAIEGDHLIPELPPPLVTASMRRISEQIADMIEDGD
jgi:acyl-CoA hydrolase